jgi:signal transduction histidine kinase
MKITTRIISGYGLLIAILAGLVVYQVITIRRMSSISRTLSQINFQNARDCLQSMRDRDLVEEFTKKAFLSSDYLENLRMHQEDFQRSMRGLGSHANSGEEQEQLKRLSQDWDGYMADIGILQQNVPQRGPIPPNLQDDLDILKAQTESVYHAILQSMETTAKKTSKTAETAVLVLWCASLVAFVTSSLVSLLIVRSISKPLAHLTEGTRAIADGQFSYRLDSSRGDEFAQLARDFNKMTSRLNELDELKKDFVSHVSHELKVPLASMRETIQLMLEEIPGPLTEKQKRLLELNLQSGTRLTSMITNLLDHSKIEAGVMKYELKKQDLIPLVRNAIAELDLQAREKQIQLKADLPENPLLLECDSDRILQVMLNLLGNAVKFSPKNSSVLVQVEKVQQAPEGLPERYRGLIADSVADGYFGLITVADTGPGISDLDKEKIFEKFHQVRQGKQIAGQGVGLGLSICRTIVQAHGGAIWVEDNPAGGCRLMVLLRSGETGEDVVARSSAPL